MAIKSANYCSYTFILIPNQANDLNILCMEFTWNDFIHEFGEFDLPLTLFRWR